MTVEPTNKTTPPSTNTNTNTTRIYNTYIQICKRGYALEQPRVTVEPTDKVTPPSTNTNTITTNTYKQNCKRDYVLEPAQVTVKPTIGNAPCLHHATHHADTKIIQKIQQKLLRTGSSGWTMVPSMLVLFCKFSNTQLSVLSSFSVRPYFHRYPFELCSPAPLHRCKYKYEYKYKYKYKYK